MSWQAIRSCSRAERNETYSLHTCLDLDVRDTEAFVQTTWD